MDLYLYRLSCFDFEDEDDEEIPNHHEETHIVETKLSNVLPMAYGFFYVGMNAIDIYPYDQTALPCKAILIFQGKEQESSDAYSIVIPYQNKALAQKVFSSWLDARGFHWAAKAVKDNLVTHLKRMTWVEPSRQDVTYAKKWDKKKMEELCGEYAEIIRKNGD